jgi:hypothetical protein
MLLTSENGEQSIPNIEKFEMGGYKGKPDG